MRRLLLRFVPILAAIVALAPQSALAYDDTGYDAQDQSEGYDISSTTRRVYQGNGHRVLKVVVRIYEGDRPLDDQNYVWFVEVRIDSRRGQAHDVIMNIWSEDLSGRGCELEDRRSRTLTEGLFRVTATTASCRVPLRFVDPGKRIRWNIHMSDDLAPNAGMYA